MIWVENYLKYESASMKRRRKEFTHLVGLSELEPISIDDGVGARDKWREDGSSLKDPAISLMRLVSDCLSLDIDDSQEKQPASAEANFQIGKFDK